MTEKRYIVGVDEVIIDTKTNREYTTWDISGVEDICDKLNNLTEENKQLRQYKDAIFNWDSSKIIRVNMNTGKVDLVDKVDEE